MWSNNSISGYLSDDNKNSNLKRYMDINVHCSIIYNRQDMEVTQVSNDAWMDKEGVIHKHWNFTQP